MSLTPADISGVLSEFRHIPYENISKIFRLGLSRDERPRRPELLFDQFHSHGWGGTCFSLTWAAVQALRKNGIAAGPVNAPVPRESFPHFALVYELGGRQYFCDPGYMIFEGIALDPAEPGRWSNTVMEYECRFAADSGLYELHSRHAGSATLRYHIDPRQLSDEAFLYAWNHSFNYMNTLVLSRIVDDKFIYIAGDYAQIRTRNHIEKYNSRDNADRLLQAWFPFSPEEIRLARTIISALTR